MGAIHKGSAWQAARAKALRGATTCHICLRPLDRDAYTGQFIYKGRHPLAPSVDHVIPVSRGGDPYDPANLRPCHYGCNARRGNRTGWTPPSATGTRAW